MLLWLRNSHKSEISMEYGKVWEVNSEQWTVNSEQWTVNSEQRTVNIIEYKPKSQKKNQWTKLRVISISITRKE